MTGEARNNKYEWESKIIHDQLDRLPRRNMGLWKFALLMLARRPANEMFHRALGRAYERGFINSTQLHDICGIWNRMVNGH